MDLTLCLPYRSSSITLGSLVSSRAVGMASTWQRWVFKVDLYTPGVLLVASPLPASVL